ncbi:MAG: M20 family metallopeptidase [Chloroflexota bacterium]
MPDFILHPPEQDALVTLLQRLLQFPTEDPPGREIEIAQFVHKTVTAMGMESELDEFLPGRANVVARVKGSGANPGLVFSAHFDTMTIGTQAWQHPPFGGEIHNGKVYGRGASDMKSGMAAMVMAAQQMMRWQDQLQGDLILAFTAGESSNCIGAKRMVARGDLDDAGAIIVSEPSSLRILLAETGTWWVKAIATGVSGHSSGASGGLSTGSNAILKLVDLINKLQTFQFDVEPHPLLGMPTISIGTIQGGSAVNQTPDYAELGLDVRFLPNMTTDAMLTDLQTLAGPDIRFETIDLKPPIKIHEDHPLVHITADAVHDCWGHIDPPGGVAYYSDAVIFSPALDIPRVIIGPGELGFSGTVDEYVDIEKLIASAAIYQQIAYEYCNQSLEI